MIQIHQTKNMPKNMCQFCFFQNDVSKEYVNKITHIFYSEFTYDFCLSVSVSLSLSTNLQWL
jgi:hypothetical protein